MTPREATAADAAALGRMLHDFNVEFDEATPGPEVLARRLTEMLARDDVVALLAGDGPDGLALLTFRPGVWSDGPVPLLEELYVVPALRNQGIGTELLRRAFAVARERGAEYFEINVDEGDVEARRFYERPGVMPPDPGRDERSLYYFRTL
ncbi:MAG TPA: GNAT family N-acetyltransferase [Solirubrobacteraceae bacterium]|nr:GNAT family N-acetyltransferase [Solirubrobacteraceae bacterium]